MSAKGNADCFDHFDVSHEPKWQAILQVRAFQQTQSNKGVENLVEQWLVDVPKNLIAYFVQRVMRFEHLRQV